MILGGGQFLFFLLWKPPSKSLSRAPVRQHAAVMILKKYELNAKSRLAESCFSSGLSRVSKQSDKEEQQTEAFGVNTITLSQNRI